MANKSLFQTLKSKFSPAADAVNEAGGRAYALDPRSALAQYAATGCLNGTFYASGETQLEKTLGLATSLDPEFVAKTAVYARERAFMKDMPALLLAVLADRGGAVLERVFDRVIDNGRMLRNFVQIVRSGAVGRKSLGSRPRRLVRNWLDARTDAQVLAASVGSSPSLADVVRMVHPKPKDAARSALYAWLIGSSHEKALLPQIVRELEAYRAGESLAVPDVPFLMLTSLPLGASEWATIAAGASFHATRMNLATFARHEVFGRRVMVDGKEELVDRIVAERLMDPEAIAKARVFPYQILAAYAQAGSAVPAVVKGALETAMETAIGNVPQIAGSVVVCPDVSGSMSSPVTGARGAGATSSVRCIDVAALVAASIVRRNPGTRVLPFEQDVVNLDLDVRAGVLANAKTLAGVGGGGTSCSAPLRKLNREGAKADLVIFVSDNESWVDTNRGRHNATAVLTEWNLFRKRNPKAKLVCIDLQPNETTQACERQDILNVGGFSDAVFELVADFAAGRMNAGHWVGVIESIAV